jgi:multidrug efflux system membrane fusion protein
MLAAAFLFYLRNFFQKIPKNGMKAAFPYSVLESLMKKRLLSHSGAVLFFLPVLCWLLSPACSGNKKDAQKKKPDRVVLVTAAPAVEKAVPVQIRAIGNGEALKTVAVKSRVGGELKEVHFREGQDVQQGDLLFTIDPDTYEAALRQAQAALARNLALLKKAQEDVRRYSDLVQKEYISQEQFEQAVTNVDALKAQIKADQAAVESARLLVGYCTIRAPIAGRTGELLADKGNMIKAQDDNKSLVVIHQIQPIYVSFAVPEQNLPDIKKRYLAGKVRLKAFISKDGQSSEDGVLTFIDNAVDKTTGTIRLKGTFENREKRLWPGQFVHIVLDLTVQTKAVVVPSRAVQTGIEGQYVYVVQPAMTAEARPVVIGRSFDGQTVIEKGLRPGENVVTDGHFQLASGVKVQIKGSPETQGPVR